VLGEHVPEIADYHGKTTLEVQFVEESDLRHLIRADYQAIALSHCL